MLCLSICVFIEISEHHLVNYVTVHSVITGVMMVYCTCCSFLSHTPEKPSSQFGYSCPLFSSQLRGQVAINGYLATGHASPEAYY